jgi:CRP/FNR family cyclic AMP-dependent transcriptional regulator
MGEIEGLDRLLKDHPFFKGMDPAILGTITGCAANERFGVGEYIFREGSPADKFYLIRRGNVAVEIHIPGREPIIVETLQEGDILGWSWLIPPYKWRGDARAIQLVRAISLDAKCLREKYESDHSLGFALFKRFVPLIVRRMEAGRLQLIDMYGKAQPRK